MTTKLNDLLPTPGYETYYEQVPDVATRTVLMVRREREINTTATASVQERGWNCWLCQDRGLTPYGRQSTFPCRCCPSGHVYEDNTACFCSAGEKYGPRTSADGERWKISSFKDVFGAWPVPPRQQASAPPYSPPPPKPTTPPPIPKPPQPPAAEYVPPPRVEWTGTVVEEIDIG